MKKSIVETSKIPLMTYQILLFKIGKKEIYQLQVFLVKGAMQLWLKGKVTENK